MELNQFYTWLSLLLSIMICKLTQCHAKPIYYDVDSYESGYGRSYDHKSYDNSYAFTYGKPLTSDHIDKLNTGYYYVDNGYIAPVSSSIASSQRSLYPYSSGEFSDSYKFSPILRYRKSRTKRKKLFVPNFFG
ncbi:hypothetical protein AWZ03_006548 [Drosophila navojoa]|uniref:Uncharacterized protein n=1 Tax=Drosophila navojoa TaxID=7232 RepID=A0A484BH81_DRONA|nr:uncharacterized protein LOC108653102 [Drosophila navojoa]TDG47111.1 hypothetical protein AWZ03_006548 [Drosophila navojoa]